jgi:hypothetical protein
MKHLSFLFVFFFSFSILSAQDDISLDLDDIKNIKTTRYSSINEVGVSISLGGTRIQKLPFQDVKTNLEPEKPNVSFRSVHGALLNPKFFIGGGVGMDFRPSNPTGIRTYFFTFPFFAELREYILDGNFNIFFSQRLGAAVHIDNYFNAAQNRGTSTGAFGEFMIGGRYVPGDKKLALHFGVGYRLQHLQRRTDVQNVLSGNTQIYSNTPEITIKHYIPVTVGITF